MKNSVNDAAGQTELNASYAQASPQHSVPALFHPPDGRKLGKTVPTLLAAIVIMLSAACGGEEEEEASDSSSSSEVVYSNLIEEACSTKNPEKLKQSIGVEFTLASNATLVCKYIKTDGNDGSAGDSWASAWGIGTLRGLGKAADATNDPGDASDAKYYLYLVKAGTYKPTDAAAPTSAERDISFNLKNYVAVYGGWSGDGFQSGGETVLSGNIGSYDVSNDNSRHVLSTSNLVRSAVLAKVTVTKGNAIGVTANELTGAGMQNTNSSPALYSVTFSDNLAGDGGAIYNSNSSPALYGVTFSGNGARYGGAMYNSGSSPMLFGAVFSGNYGAFGTAMYNYSSSAPVLFGSTFIANFLTDNAADTGAAIYNSNSSFTVFGSTFYGNHSSGFNKPSVLYHDGNGAQNAVMIANSIFYGNTTPQYSIATGGADVEKINIVYSIFEGGVGGIGGDLSTDNALTADAGFSLDVSADNGGMVWTMAINGNSQQAVNAGTHGGMDGANFCYNSTPTGASKTWLRMSDLATPCNNVVEHGTDARGYSFSGLPVIGAYELNGTAP